MALKPFRENTFRGACTDIKSLLLFRKMKSCTLAGLLPPRCSEMRDNWVLADGMWDFHVNGGLWIGKMSGDAGAASCAARPKRLVCLWPLIWFVTASNLVRKANISGMMWLKAVPHPCLSLGVLNCAAEEGTFRMFLLLVPKKSAQSGNNSPQSGH